jgi:hypothetical protein
MGDTSELAAILRDGATRLLRMRPESAVRKSLERHLQEKAKALSFCPIHFGGHGPA